MSQKRKSLTVEEKCRIIRLLEDGKNRGDLHKELSISLSTISKIWKDRVHLRGLLKLNCQKLKRRRKCNNTEIEKMLLQWIKQELTEQNSNGHIKSSVLLEKANEFAQQRGINFNCSLSWIQRFRIRNAYVFQKTCDENKQVRAEYSNEDIFRDKATKLFPDISPLVSKSCRLCLVECTEKNSLSLYDCNHEFNWIELISKYLNLKLVQDKSYSTIICQKCVRQLKQFHYFAQNVEQCQFILQETQNQASLCIEELKTNNDPLINIKKEGFERIATDFEVVDFQEESISDEYEVSEASTDYIPKEQEDPIRLKEVVKEDKTFNRLETIEDRDESICNICHIVFKNVPTLITHYQHIHKECKDFKFFSCKVCGLQFIKESFFQHHLTKSKRCAADIAVN